MPTALLILVAIAQGPPAPDWKPIRPADGSFAAEMPSNPKHASQEIPGDQGAFQRETDTCTFDGARFTIEATRYAGPITEAIREATLDRAASAYVESRQGQLLKRSEVAVDGRPGWDLTIRSALPGARSGTFTSRCRLVLASQTLYSLSVASAVDRPLPASTSRFLRSLRFDARPPVPIADATPEQALRTFFLAMAVQDDAALEAVTLPADDLDRLLEGPPVAPGRFAAAQKFFGTQAIRVLKVGDEFTAARKKQTVAAEEVADDRALLLPKDAPFPTRLDRVDGRWKVDARPIIASRKAAEAPKSSTKARKGGR